MPTPRTSVNLCAYATEGGLDGRHQPATVFAPTIALGRHEGPGEACGLWTRYEDVIDAAADLGVTSLRLDVSWARIEPRRDHYDENALERYAKVVEHARSRGLFTSVCAIDLAWPAWLGLEAWLLPWVQPVALTYLRTLREALPADGFVIIGDLPAVVNGYLDATAPPWRHGARDDARSVRTNFAALRRALDLESGTPVIESVLATPGRSGAGVGSPDEVVVASLVAGTGPLGAPRGLLQWSQGKWTPTGESLGALS